MGLRNFLTSPKILTVIQLSQMSGQRPSKILNIDDSYAAFCFDEAVFFIVSQIKEGNEPIFDSNEPKKKDNQNTLSWLVHHRG